MWYNISTLRVKHKIKIKMKGNDYYEKRDNV